MVERFLLIGIFFLSILFAPWWLSFFIAIIIASSGEDLLVLPIGGVLLDVLFGVPIATLGGFSFLYTALLSIIALAGFILKDVIV